LQHADQSPVINALPGVNLLHDGQVVQAVSLQPVNGLPGGYAASLSGLPVGSYRLQMDAPTLPAAVPLPAAGAAALPSPGFAVLQPPSREWDELAADVGLLNRLADMTHGVCVEPVQAARVLARFGPPALVRMEPARFELWNSWWLLLFLLAVLAAEWLLRKRVNLP
jgi:hypothetical protein